ncbi:hypothetical protein TSAR_007995 [Trichomalopsis sarcophagae]|uniref:Uncharacterized protein n=1 Tax=Trichomalopsis sarcophagae TaxID=543379 RepID=A0A232FN86_9HYME|nr:hypothetical protein TSAR_007995 [Trichomalopsis sarcophagae]
MRQESKGGGTTAKESRDIWMQLDFYEFFQRILRYGLKQSSYLQEITQPPRRTAYNYFCRPTFPTFNLPRTWLVRVMEGKGREGQHGDWQLRLSPQRKSGGPSEGLEELIGPLTKLFRASIALAHVPAIWKTAKVVFAIGHEVRIGSWEACHEETWELPEAAEKCPICHNHKDSQATLIRLVGQEIFVFLWEWVGSLNLRLQFE